MKTWRDWPLTAKAAAAVALPLAVLLSAVLSGQRLQHDLNAAERDVRRALAIQTDIQALHSLVAEATTGVRGYLLVGREDFLTPYEQARAALPRTQAALREKIRDRVMRDHLARLDALVSAELNSLDTLRRSGASMTPETLREQLVRSKVVMDRLRRVLRDMDARETLLLDRYARDASDALARQLTMSTLSALLVVLVATAALLFLFRGVIGRIRVLAQGAEQLARGESLTPLSSGEDELGVLAERLQNAGLLLAQRADEARLANEAKTRFLSRTSHELRTPMNAILGFARLLDHDLRQTPRQREQVQHIVRAGEQLLTLIDEILDIARIESGDLRLQCEPLPGEGVIDEVLTLLGPMARERGIALVHLPPGDALSVFADRQRLRQVLVNLVGNGIKFTPAGGRVSVSGERQGERVALHVTDTGPGLSEDAQARLFTPFERLDAEARGVSGTGLGLALSRQLMQQMHGDLQVHSAPGQGSTFTVSLPAAAAMFVPATRESARLATLGVDAGTQAVLASLVTRRPGWTLAALEPGQTPTTPPDLLIVGDVPGPLPEWIHAGARVIHRREDKRLQPPLNVPALLALLDEIRP